MALNISNCLTTYNGSSVESTNVFSEFIIILQILGAIILIIGLVLNFLFLLTIISSGHLRNIPNIFLINLCASNLVYIGAIIVGYAIIGGMTGMSVSLCHLIGSFSVLYNASYCLTLVAVGVYHYRKVYNLEKRKTRTILCLYGTTWMCVCLIIVISLVTNSTSLYTLCNILCLMHSNGNICECSIVSSNQAHVQAFDLLFIFSLFALLCTYSLLIWTLKKSTSKAGYGNQVRPSICSSISTNNSTLELSGAIANVHEQGTRTEQKRMITDRKHSRVSKYSVEDMDASKMTVQSRSSTSTKDYFHNIDDLTTIAYQNDNHKVTQTTPNQLGHVGKNPKPGTIGHSNVAIQIHIKTVKRGLMLVVLYKVCSLPSMILSLSNVTTSNLQQNESLIYIWLCAFVFDGLNVIFCPLLYFILDKTVRKSFFKLFSKCRIDDAAICQILPHVDQ
ncbi:unnamed protein product [Owenia fusiformis]|uniref:Uncharacterized protein n=1 Tax=Owenia fusiformis TaxID=6347 RepID=A0A8J1UBG5_OWEFU|nr:unnamed protein product [Owenia fusiformis]